MLQNHVQKLIKPWVKECKSFLFYLAYELWKGLDLLMPLTYLG